MSPQERLQRAARAHVDADSAASLLELQRALEAVEWDAVVGDSLVGVPRPGQFGQDPTPPDALRPTE